MNYIVVSALAALCHWAAVSWASSITNTTFLIRANHTCLQPARLSCPPHTWKQSAFLVDTALLGCPPPLMYQQPNLPFFLPPSLLLLPLVFASSPPAPLSHRCSLGTLGSSKHHPNLCQRVFVCVHTHRDTHFTSVPKLLPLIFSPKNNRVLTAAYICVEHLLAYAIAYQILLKNVHFEHWPQPFPVS